MRLLAIVTALLLVFGLVDKVLGEPIATANEGGTVVTLYDEPCALQAVGNLPFKATWAEGGKTYQGCFGSRPGVAILYFDDRSVVVLPGQIFKRVTGL